VVDDRHGRLPRIGLIRVKEPTVALRARIDDGSARVLSATVSERAGWWFELARSDSASMPWTR
jgi:putative transposase